MSYNHMGYNRVGIMMRRCNGIRGFRLNPRRFSVQRLRSKFLFLLKIFKRWRSSYGNVLGSMKRNVARSSSRRDTSSKRSLVMAAEELPTYTYSSDYRLRYYGRSNSFYSEAIADCLDFIKRNSLSVDEKPVLNQR